MDSKQFNIGLVLSGGGARGYAHLGFLEALNEAGIYPDVIAGTSAGAIAGALYADGYSPREILLFTNSAKRFDLMKPTLPRESLLQISGLIKIIQTYLRAKTFADLKIPLYVTATDINNAKAVYFSEGDLLDVIIASASIPVMFPPVRIGESMFVDGGVMDNFPVSAIEKKCKILIGSFVNQVGPIEKFSGLMKLAERTFMLSMSKEIIEKSRRFDLCIAPEALKDYKVLDTSKAEEMFNIGYLDTREKLKNFDIKKLLKDRSE
ncbi:MAG TPA: patatin-like phospholipase family protein [Bacteroidales bacterium]|nr:patatin-like phospholipase family protein [Bacteroidales bacterium]